MSLEIVDYEMFTKQGNQRVQAIVDAAIMRKGMMGDKENWLLAKKDLLELAQKTGYEEAYHADVTWAVFSKLCKSGTLRLPKSFYYFSKKM